jgi:hypothetical protein
MITSSLFRYLAIIAYCLFCRTSSRIVRLHIIPHSHVDPMWVKTSESYKTVVHTILKNVLISLLENRNRTFIWESPYFLDSFINEYGKHTTCSIFNHNKGIRCKNFLEAIKYLTENGQLEMVGGGWVSHDEALTSAIQGIDNIATGREWISNTIGHTAIPSVSWFVDSFGHSASTTSILRGFGYSGEVLNRVHYSIKSYIRTEGPTVFIHNTGVVNEPMNPRISTAASVSCAVGNSKVLLSTLLPVHYSSPVEITSSFKMSDEKLKIAAASIFQHAVEFRDVHYHGNYIPDIEDQIILMGNDFTFSNSDEAFLAVESIIREVNKLSASVSNSCYQSSFRRDQSSASKHSKNNCISVHAHFSTPSLFFSSVLSRVSSTCTRDIPVISGDLLPYSDNYFTDWTGYYGSRPNIKKAIRYN